MKFNDIQRIEYECFCSAFGVGECLYLYKKKYIIYANGKMLIAYYKKGCKLPCRKMLFCIESAVVRKLFWKIRFLAHHANMNLVCADDCGSKLKIYYCCENYEVYYRGLAIGIFVKEETLSKSSLKRIIFLESIFQKFVLKYGDGKPLYNYDFSKEKPSA